MRLWDIALCLFIFGFCLSCVNDLAFYDVVVPESNYNGPTEAEIRDLSDEAMSTGLSPLYIFFIIQTLGKALIAGLLAIITILPLCCSILGAFGIPLVISVPICMIIQGPAWFVELNGIYQLITGYNEEGMK
jgi:hypothetical protein